MSTTVIVSVLTGLAAVVVVLTRLRLGGTSDGAGRLSTAKSLVTVHTVAGVVALVTWVVFLVAPDDSTLGGNVLGIVSLAFWWVTVVAGLLILVRWLPSHGKHASDGQEDTWSDGPGLSLLGHVGMLVGVIVFTWAYLTSAV
ncbi:hypothetical protein [Nocardioides mangrovi]|uniref:DUF2269 family protein n=1 Tax=Nocardioides mangrovi TaxID=2874580 RepID=A0ABS7UGF8_9ACTN|nr:hypothetical protein [Nocardioides mangrovi]MBZ5740104.1 hypothetical protein [Nocardioides mangrovi]